MPLNLLNWRHALRQRLGAVVGAVAASAGCCLCGLFLTLVMAPRQALQAAGIARLPAMSAADVQAAAPDSRVLFTGVLADNTPLRAGSDLVVYAESEWEVTVPAPDDDGAAEPHGTWRSHAVTTPDLTVTVDGQPLLVYGAQAAQLSGALREELVPGEGATASDNGTPRPAGSVRYRGLANGALVTVLGRKSSAGGVGLEHLFGGDRTAFLASQQQAASNFLISGIFSIVLAPVVLVGGVLAALAWRRR
jgi:hypothetical protein